MDLHETVSVCKDLAVAAGAAVMEIYAGDFSVALKSDKSPLTLADTVSNDIIISGLQKKFHNCAVLSEESRDDPSRLKNDYCFVVDPLDGTKEFVSRSGQFTVNIALSYKNGTGGEIKISVSDRLEGLVAVSSKSHLGEREERLLKENARLIARTVYAGSSIKGCMVARGVADVYYRFGPTCEWDVAAMHCVVEQAGGVFRRADAAAMRYNRRDTLNSKGFFAVNRPENIWTLNE